MKVGICMEKKLTSDDFYGVSMYDCFVLNRLTYKGRGRPRKTDYISVKELLKKINRAVDSYLKATYKHYYSNKI